MKKYCRLCKKKEERNQCGYGPKMWDKYSVNDANDDEIKKAAEDSGITSGDGGEGGMGESHVSNFSDAVLEGNKSGDNSLRDWFSKSRSSDGKPGWFNSVVNMQENPVQSNPDKPQNQSAVQAK